MAPGAGAGRSAKGVAGSTRGASCPVGLSIKVPAKCNLPALYLDKVCGVPRAGKAAPKKPLRGTRELPRVCAEGWLLWPKTVCFAQFLGRFPGLAGPCGAAEAVASARHRDSVEGRLGKGRGWPAHVAGTSGFVACSAAAPACSDIFEQILRSQGCRKCLR